MASGISLGMDEVTRARVRSGDARATAAVARAVIGTRTLREAADQLGIGTRTLQRWIAQVPGLRERVRGGERG